MLATNSVLWHGGSACAQFDQKAQLHRPNEIHTYLKLIWPSEKCVLEKLCQAADDIVTTPASRFSPKTE